MNTIKIINNILWTKWDPIEINSNQLLLSEYEVYAQKLYLLNKIKKLSELEIYNFLLDLEINDLGMQIQDTNRQEVAKQLYKILP